MWSLIETTMEDESFDFSELSFYSNDVSSPKNSWLKILVQSVKLFEYMQMVTYIAYTVY